MGNFTSQNINKEKVKNVDIKNNCLSILILGLHKSGKTSFILSYLNDDTTIEDLDRPTSLLNIPCKRVKVNNIIYKTFLKELFYVNGLAYESHGIVLIYKIDNIDSFYFIKTYIEKVKDRNLILIANKNNIDKRQISYKEGKDLAKKYNIDFFEIDIKEYESVIMTMNKLINNIVL
jgi:hypothetical protein